MTSGSANFQESSAEVGDTIHADFTWLNAQYHPVGECYATMYIYDPNNNPVTSYIEEASYSGSKTLSFVTDMVGDWKAVLKVWDGSNWLEYTDIVPVSSPGVTSGSANFQESSALIGDTIHADFTWTNAHYHPVGECYATMYIYDPVNTPVVSYIEEASYTGSMPLACTTDMPGDWTAVLKVWDGSNWLEYTDIVNVGGDGGGGFIVIRQDLSTYYTTKPSGEHFERGDHEKLVNLWFQNIGDGTADTVYIRLYAYPGEANQILLKETKVYGYAPGAVDGVNIYADIPLDATNPFPLGITIWCNGEWEPSWGTSSTSMFNVGIGEDGEIPWGTILVVGGVAIIGLLVTIFLARR